VSTGELGMGRDEDSKHEKYSKRAEAAKTAQLK